jgi:hypothetical protein
VCRQLILGEVFFVGANAYDIVAAFPSERKSPGPVARAEIGSGAVVAAESSRQEGLNTFHVNNQHKRSSASGLCCCEFPGLLVLCTLQRACQCLAQVLGPT